MDHSIYEIYQLLDNSIDHLVWLTKLKEWEKQLWRHSILNYIFFVLRPLSHGIYFDFVAANLPSCFIQLRVLSEQLAKCSLADRKFGEKEFFQEK